MLEQIGRYRIISELGRGAMGVVYKAQDPTIGRLVAIKTIRLSELAHPQERQQLRDRLFREAQSAGILSHPGIVTIYDIAEEGNLAFITMEFVEGQTLEKILDCAQITDARRMLSVATQTAVALDYAHSKGIIHRDIKPGNIMVTPEGMVKITDFGIARIASSKFTNTGTVMGTPSYMSPEQVRGAVVDGRSDMFSLAVVVYEMLTGQKPFTGDSITTIIFKIVSENPLPPKDLNPSVGAKVDAVVMRALAKDPADRFSTCRGFSDALEAAGAQTANLAPTIRRMPSMFGATEISDPALVTQPERKAEAPPQPAGSASVVEKREEAAAPPPAPPPAVVATPTPPIAAAAPPAAPPPVVAPPPRQPTIPMFDPTASRAPVLPPLERVKVDKPDRQERKTEKRKLPDVATIDPGPVEFATVAPAQPSGRRTWLPIAAVLVLGAVGGGVWWQKQQASVPVDPDATTAETNPASEAPKPAAKKSDVAVTPSPSAAAPKAASAPAPDAAPAARAQRMLNVTTEEPGARAVVDGNPEIACNTPCSIPVAPGRHSLVLTRAGFNPERRDITVGAESIDMRISLRPILGTVMLSTDPPGATVTVDGKPFYGQTPLTLKLPPGSHLISVTKDGVGSAQRTVEVTEETTHLRITVAQ